MLADDQLVRAAGRVLVAGFPGASVPEALARDIAAHLLGGVILFRRNIESVAHSYSLISELRSLQGRQGPCPLLMSVDQEGGRVARLSAPVLRVPAARRLAMRGSPVWTEQVAFTLGEQLRALGFTMNFAPVLDVDTNPDNPVIGDRAFGPDPETVITHGLAFAKGLERAGVAACGKHFPGHGDTDLDSHLALPRLHHSRDRIWAVELEPFRAAAHVLPAMMTAHVVVSALDKKEPATLSPTTLRVLREELGFFGAIVSDDLEMNAVAEHRTLEQAAEMAIAAGCDVLLVCSKFEQCATIRQSLALRAKQDAQFAQRLLEASGRATELYRRFPPSPMASTEELARLLDRPSTRALQAELDRLVEP